MTKTLIQVKVKGESAYVRRIDYRENPDRTWTCEIFVLNSQGRWHPMEKGAAYPSECELEVLRYAKAPLDF